LTTGYQGDSDEKRAYMNPLQTFLYIYVTGVVVTSFVMYWAITMVRKSDEDSAKKLVQGLDKISEASGLRDSGLAVLTGLAWPWTLAKALTKEKK
jgi:hypothetical protein